VSGESATYRSTQSTYDYDNNYNCCCRNYHSYYNNHGIYNNDCSLAISDVDKFVVTAAMCIV